ncbi:hypothetical protein CSC94_07215 [Zhengella mangrovi]|uniref:Uncharacterized protein n=1 Tax=Zhengella mangrovi TaxID=1982044 RepID=A0A2G1QPT6_9HYPH|nr:hypothetical protein [Zhengella mangrovi]PHP67489.1 hypothetical protein CSC94_07215 [Zhengella mangrovi]
MRPSSGKVNLPGGAPADLLLAPLVISLRLPVLFAEAAGGSLCQGEARKAVAEKVRAGIEGLWEAQFSLWRSTMEFWPHVLAGRHPADLVANSVTRASKAAVRPASKTVRRNYDRLRKR